ncbi:MAG: hypothetical protein P1U49_06545 [Minwuia sp.]|nr:hypothetical protein [Minwuia sp.]
MQQDEIPETVASGEFSSFRFRTDRLGQEVLHRITVTGPIDLKLRIPVYKATLAANPSANYFCILDNRAGFENVFAYEDILYLANLVLEAGIRRLYAATVTNDPEYAKLVELANVVVGTSQLEGALLATGKIAEAEAFVRRHMQTQEASRGS